MKILSYRNFKKTHDFRHGSSCVEVNMNSHNNFTTIFNDIPEKGKKVKDIIEDISKINKGSYNPESGIFVHYRKRNRWGIPHLYIFYRNSNERSK